MSDQQTRTEVIMPTEEDLKDFQKQGRKYQRKKGLGEIALGLLILFIVFLPVIRSAFLGPADTFKENLPFGGIWGPLIGIGITGAGITRILKP